MNPIVNLVELGRIEEAISILKEISHSYEQATISLVKSRYLDLQRDLEAERIYPQDYKVDYARIKNSLINLSEKVPSHILLTIVNQQSKTEQKPATTMFPIDQIKAFRKKYLNTHRDFAKEAKQIIDQIRAYQDEREVYTGNQFDPEGEKSGEIMKAWNDLELKATRKQIEESEGFVKKINVLLRSGKNEDIAKACDILDQHYPGDVWGEWAKTMRGDVETLTRNQIITEIEFQVKRI